jgi:uncharacterized protein
MERYLKMPILEDLGQKFIFISGPRQVGKTTLTQSLCDSFQYLNFDIPQDRKMMLQQHFDLEQKMLVFDELHKMKKWKLWLKGIFDAKKFKNVVVTGSAKLETFRKTGDSMAGRYFHFHLFPFDLKELKQFHVGDPHTNLEELLELSGFPEPFLAKSKARYMRWRKTHLDVIIKEDMLSIETIRRIADLEFLVELLREKVGSPLSFNSLREDLATDDKTIKRWVISLENSYVLFKVTPFFTSIKYSIKKSAKYYFFDFPRVENESTRLENLVALSLFKECHLRNDVLGENYSLHYIQNKQKNEIDFLVVKGKKPIIMIEVKLSDDTPSKNFQYFEAQLKKLNPQLKKVQLVKNLKRQFQTPDEILVRDLAKWLSEMEF